MLESTCFFSPVSCPHFCVFQLVYQLAAVAALCVQYEADFRPNMTIVVKALQPLLNSKPAGPDAHA
jgi:hypothetical protein